VVAVLTFLAGCAQLGNTTDAGDVEAPRLTDTMHGCFTQLSEPDYGVARGVVECDGTTQGNVTFLLDIPCPAHSRDDILYGTHALAAGVLEVKLWAGGEVADVFQAAGTGEVSRELPWERWDSGDPVPFRLEIHRDEPVVGSFRIVAECGSWP
jgi:hypothetical protein